MNTKITNAKSAGFGVGFVTSLYTTGVLTIPGLLLSPPVFLGALVGTVLLQVVTDPVHEKLARVEEVNRSSLTAHFALRAGATLVGAWTGLALVSSFVSIAANPFTLPAMLAARIGAALIIAAFVYVGMKIKQHQNRVSNPLGHLAAMSMHVKPQTYVMFRADNTDRQGIIEAVSGIGELKEKQSDKGLYRLMLKDPKQDQSARAVLGKFNSVVFVDEQAPQSGLVQAV